MSVEDCFDKFAMGNSSVGGAIPEAGVLSRVRVGGIKLCTGKQPCRWPCTHFSLLVTVTSCLQVPAIVTSSQ